MNQPKDKLAYSREEAAVACGVSLDTVKRAITAGDLATVSPLVGGRRISRILVLREELERWLRA